MKTLPLALLLFTAACAGLADGGPWRTDELKRQAEADFGCKRDALSAYEAAAGQYSVRGCGKRALYEMQNCNRVTRKCSYVLRGDVLAASPVGP
jgi:hypothetical protein